METIINSEFCYFVGVTWPYTERLTTGFTKTELEMITNPVFYKVHKATFGEE